MWSPKRFAPPPNHRTQSNRRHRPPPMVAARRFLSRSFRSTRKHVEQWHQWQMRGCVLVQQLVDSIFPQELLLADKLLGGDHDCLRVKTVLGTLLSGGLATKPETEKEENVKEEKFLICEIRIVGVDGDLREIAKKALTIKENLSYTLTEVNDDLEKIVKTGFFSKCKAHPEDTRDGILLSINVEPNPKVTSIVSTGSNVLPHIVFEQAVQELLGKPLNINNLKAAAAKINEWYLEQGLVAQVYDSHFEGSNVAVLHMSEAIVDRVGLRYRDAVTGDLKEEGNVKPDVILRYMGLKPGSVMNRTQAQKDVEAVYQMGLFTDVGLNFDWMATSTYDIPKVDILVDVYENRKTGGLGLGAGWSGQSLTEGSLPGFVGNIEYVQKNMFGLGQRLISRLEFGQVDKLFKLEYNEPWIIGNKHRTSRTFGLMNTRTSGNPFYAYAESAAGIQHFKTVIGRLMGSFTIGRALTEHWNGTMGLTAQRITLMDDNSRAIRQDLTRAPVNVSGDFRDLMLAPFFKAVFSGWANSHFMLMAEKAIPMRPDWLGITKASARAEKIFPMGRTSFVLCAKGGATLGKVPPYQAFPLGGINSIRGYREGSVGTARHYVEGTAEIRFPLVSNLQGCVFFDCGSDLDTGSSVVGNPGHSRNKPGKGAGFGVGVRVNSPVGPLRLEWAWNDKGSRLFHAGFGDHR